MSSWALSAATEVTVSQRLHTAPRADDGLNTHPRCFQPLFYQRKIQFLSKRQGCERCIVMNNNKNLMLRR